MRGRSVGHYRLVEVLGSGSMGRVWKAWDERLERWVAIKFLPPELSNEDRACARFQREAQAASSLEHGHICTIYDFGRAADGAAYLVMAWYDGQTLEQKLVPGPLPAQLAVSYARQIALGMGAAHRQGIVHRDIKPANLMITHDDQAVILDFGVAYLSARTRLSRPGSQTGTLAYMAPEQFRGDQPAPTMDVWSLGVLLFEMLTGRLPFSGEYPAALMFAITHEDPLSLPDNAAAATPGLRAVIEKCLTKEPQDRYPTAAELAADLAGVAGETDRVPEALLSAGPANRRWGRRAVFGLAAVVLVGLGLVAGNMILPGDRAGAPPTETSGSRGVAVLPFTLEQDGEARRELGEGLAWLVADRLAWMVGGTGAFWVVPMEDVLMYEIADRRTVWDQLGIGRTITGAGTMDGSTLTLRLDYADAATGAAAVEIFRDDVANLPTWRRDLAVWASAQVDPDGVVAVESLPDRGDTQVPEALYAFLDGIGWSRRYTRDPTAQLTFTERALAAFGGAVASDSSFAAARCEYGGTLMRPRTDRAENWTDICESELRAAIALDPRAAGPHCYLGRLRLTSGDTLAAVAAFDQALRLAPGFKPAQLAKLELALSAGDERAAVSQMAAMEAVRPGYAGDDLAQGVRYWRVGKVARSADCFRAAVAAAPHSGRALYYLGAAVWEFERSPEAQSLFSRALALVPASPLRLRIRLNLATAYYYEGRYAAALEEYLKTLALDPQGSYDVWRGIAECYRWSPGYEDSVDVAYQRTRRLAERNLALMPADSDLKADLATFCSVLGDTARTLELLTELADEPRLGPDAEFKMAVAWEDLGRRERALARLANALDRGLSFTRVEGYPGLRNLRADPRYAQIVTEHR